MNDITVYMIIFMIVQTLVVGFLLYNIEENAKNSKSDTDRDTANLKIHFNRLSSSVLDITEWMDQVKYTLDDDNSDLQSTEKSRDKTAIDPQVAQIGKSKEFDHHNAQKEALKKARGLAKAKERALDALTGFDNPPDGDDKEDLH